jgi:hypothetical protein
MWLVYENGVRWYEMGWDRAGGVVSWAGVDAGVTDNDFRVTSVSFLKRALDPTHSSSLDCFLSCLFMHIWSNWIEQTQLGRRS